MTTITWIKKRLIVSIAAYKPIVPKTPSNKLPSPPSKANKRQMAVMIKVFFNKRNRYLDAFFIQLIYS